MLVIPIGIRSRGIRITLGTTPYLEHGIFVVRLLWDIVCKAPRLLSKLTVCFLSHHFQRFNIKAWFRSKYLYIGI